LKRTLSRLALGGLLLVGSVPGSAKAGGMFPYQTHVGTLDNGLKVIVVPMSSNGLVAYWSVVRTGSRDEYEPGHTGFAHFFEHMMFRGTAKFPADKYGEITTKMGADDNAFTSDDITAYHLSVTSADLEQVMEIESDRFQNLSYAEAAFKTEAGAVAGEYDKNRMSPFFTLEEAIHKAAFDKHTYGHTTMGYAEDIQRMPEMYDYSRSFFQRYYRPENVVLLVVGDVKPAHVMALAQRYYGDWKPGYVPPQVPVEPPQTAERHIDVAYTAGKTLPIVMVAYKNDRFDPKNKNFIASMVLADLAFGETSELHKKLVLDEQVVEFIEGESSMNRDPSLFAIIARVKDPAKVDYVLGEIDRTVGEFQTTPPDAQRVADVKSRNKYGFLMNLETPSAVAGALSRIIALTGGAEAVDQMFATLDKVTPQDVQTAARTYLGRERRTVAVLREGEH
jgi:zinc protease